jgi:hypothetical protein
MNAFPNGVCSRDDAIKMLQIIDGQIPDNLGEWEIDDFVSVPHEDSKIESCRLRVRDELVDLFWSRKAEDRAEISLVVGELVQSLKGSVA